MPELHESIYGPPIVIPGDHPTKEGLAFFGWAVIEGGEVEYTDTIPRPLPEYESKVMTLYAVWGEGYTITFDSDGGSHVKSQTVIKNTKAVKPADPTKEHNKFLGWYLDDNLFDFDNEITSDITLKAKWLPSYLVEFDSKGGSEVASQYVEPGSKVNKPADPTKTGNKFLGWYLNGDLFDFNTVISSDITLTAEWLQLYVVAFDTAGGSVVPAQYVEPGATAVKPADPTRSGYEFVGWYYKDAPFDFDTPINSDMTIVASWHSDQPAPTPQPSERIVEKEEEVIVNPDGSTTTIEKETIIERDGTVTESISEVTEEEDGSITEKSESTHTDRDGNVIKETYEAVTMEDREGNTITSSVKTRTESDSSTRTEVETVVRDSDGRVTDTEVIITKTDVSGKEDTIVVTGDHEKVEAIVPDTELTNLHEASAVIKNIDTREVSIVIESDGEVVISRDYISEAALKDFGIAIKSEGQKVSLDSDAIQNLSRQNKDAVMSVKKISASELTEPQRRVISDNYAMSLTIDVGDKKISDLGGKAFVSVPCDKPYDHVYYVSDGGMIEEISCKYNAETNTLDFTLVHFSVYTLTVGPLVIGEIENDLTIFIAIAAVTLLVVTIVVAVVIKKR